jgi:hypothetical protein
MGLQVEEIDVRGVEPLVHADPGNAGAIVPWGAVIVEITTAGAETRTLADPQFKGQELTLVLVVAVGACVITAASPVNQTGNNTITLTNVGDFIVLTGKYNATDGWEWQVVQADGAALSTVA